MQGNLQLHLTRKVTVKLKLPLSLTRCNGHRVNTLAKKSHRVDTLGKKGECVDTLEKPFTRHVLSIRWLNTMLTRLILPKF